MQLEAFQTLGGKTYSIDNLAVVVVNDRFGNPLMVACELSPGMYEIAKVGDPDFEKALQVLGINKTVVVTDIQPPPPRRGDRQVMGPNSYGT